MTSELRSFKEIVEVARPVSLLLAQKIERIGPLKPAGPIQRSAVEHLYKAVISQQISGKSADAIWSRVIEFSDSHGLHLNDVIGPTFEKQIRALGVSGFKFRALCAVRDSYMGGDLDEDKLIAMSQIERQKLLINIWGIGQWTIDMLGIFHFNEADIWPHTDATAGKTLSKFLKDCSVSRVVEGFAPNRSLLARYMWQLNDNI